MQINMIKKTFTINNSYEFDDKNKERNSELILRGSLYLTAYEKDEVARGYKNCLVDPQRVIGIVTNIDYDNNTVDVNLIDNHVVDNNLVAKKIDKICIMALSIGTNIHALINFYIPMDIYRLKELE